MTVKVPVPLYPGVPPEADTVTVVDPPLQAMVPAEAEALRAEGWVTVTEVVAVHPLASVTVYP